MFVCFFYGNGFKSRKMIKCQNTGRALHDRAKVIFVDNIQADSELLMFKLEDDGLEVEMLDLTASLPRNNNQYPIVVATSRKGKVVRFLFHYVKPKFDLFTFSVGSRFFFSRSKRALCFF